MSDQRSLKISILGKNYSIVTDEQDDILNEAAVLVDSLMQQMVTSTESSAEMFKKTTFVALQIAVDLIKKQRELKTITNSTKSLNALLRESQDRHNI